MTRATRLIFAALLAAAIQPVAAQPAASPVGNWRTFDDQDGKESGAVNIFERGGMLYGTITRIADPAQAAALCVDCTDDRKDKPVLGLQVIRGLRADGDGWSGGEIVDPKTGRVYKASLRLQDGGAKLAVRGYIGLSLLGRTQIWVRE